MSLSASTAEAASANGLHLHPEVLQRASHEPPLQIIRRNGKVTPFDVGKITVAMTKAFLAVEGHNAAASRRVHEAVEVLTAEVVAALTRRIGEGRTFHIEDVQDQVELALMRSEHHKVARAYVLYREERARTRALEAAAKPQSLVAAITLHVTRADGVRVPLDSARLSVIVNEACAGLDGVDPTPVLEETRRNLYDGITLDELALAGIMSARTLVEQEPNYAFVAARLLLDKLRTEVLSYVHGSPISATQADISTRYAEYFPAYVRKGIAAELLDPELARFDLARISAALKPERDLQFQFLGLQTLYDRYFLHENNNADRASAGVLHAGRHGAGAAGNRPRSKGDRVLRSAVVVRLHGLHPDAVQCRHPAAATVVLLPDHDAPTISTASSRASRTTRCWRNIPADLAMTGPACVASAPTSRAPTAKAKASCPS